MAFPRLNLISWYVFMFGGLFALASIHPRRRRYRLDLLYPLQQHLLEWLGHRHGGRNFHQRLLLHFHRTQFHRHDSQAARSRHDLVSPAALCLDAVFDQPDFRPGHAGAGHHADVGGVGTRFRDRHFRSPHRRRPAPLPASLLVLFASGGLHHDPSRHGRRQRTDRRLFPQADLRLRLHRLRQPRHRLPRLSRLGPSHVRQRPVHLCRHDLLAPELLRRRSLGDQGLQLDGHALQGPYHLRCAPALRLQFHRALHHRRHDRA